MVVVRSFDVLGAAKGEARGADLPMPLASILDRAGGIAASIPARLPQQLCAMLV